MNDTVKFDLVERIRERSVGSNLMSNPHQKLLVRWDIYNGKPLLVNFDVQNR